MRCTEPCIRRDNIRGLQRNASATHLFIQWHDRWMQVFSFLHDSFLGICIKGFWWMRHGIGQGRRGKEACLSPCCYECRWTTTTNQCNICRRRPLATSSKDGSSVTFSYYCSRKHPNILLSIPFWWQKMMNDTGRRLAMRFGTSVCEPFVRRFHVPFGFSHNTIFLPYFHTVSTPTIEGSRSQLIYLPSWPSA